MRRSAVADTVAVGQSFGRWTVTGPFYRAADGSAFFPVECSCGSRKDVKLRYLRNGQSRSCGCLHKDELSARQTTHGRSKDPRFKYLWLNYKMTPEDWDKIHDEQLGRCPICLRTLSESRVHVDHDHTTGEVRGLLCHSCNVAIGHLREDPESMRRAIDYLSKGE